jgi:hypothetical protein
LLPTIDGKVRLVGFSCATTEAEMNKAITATKINLRFFIVCFVCKIVKNVCLFGAKLVKLSKNIPQ